MQCIECGHPVESLYTIYSRDNIRATTCTNCGRFADKYTEYDPVLVALDVALLRPQAIRHVVFNVLPKHQPLTARLYMLIVLFDVYIHWALYEKAPKQGMASWLVTTSILTQYMAFLSISLVDSMTIYVVTLVLARLTTRFGNARALFIAVLISSLCKLLPLLTLIWDYDTSKVMHLSWLIIGLVTTDFLHVTVGCAYGHALAISVAALAARWAVCEQVMWPWLIRLTS